MFARYSQNETHTGSKRAGRSALVVGFYDGISVADDGKPLATPAP